MDERSIIEEAETLASVGHDPNTIANYISHALNDPSTYEDILTDIVYTKYSFKRIVAKHNTK